MALEWTGVSSRVKMRILTVGLSNWILFIIAVMAVESRSERCLQENVTRRYLKYSDVKSNITFQVSGRLTHRLVTDLMVIFVKEVLGYEDVEVISESNNLDIDGVLSNLSYVYNDPFASRPPPVMINMEVLLNSTYDLAFELEYALRDPLKAGITNHGDIAPYGQYGWFVPEELSHALPFTSWRLFMEPAYMDFFLPSIDDMEFIRRNSVDGMRYFCNEPYCHNGQFIPDTCKSNKCAVLLASYPNITQGTVSDIVKLNLSVSVVWLGPNTYSVVETLIQKYVDAGHNKSLVFFDWMPKYGELFDQDFVSVNMPDCQAFNLSYCYRDNVRLIKLSWQKLDFYARPVYDAIHLLKFTTGQYGELIRNYKKTGDTREAACRWLKDNQDIWTYWKTDESIELIIAGIYPTDSTAYNTNSIATATSMAIAAIEKNGTLLKGYKLTEIRGRDGCNDISSLKYYLKYFNNYPQLVGILGPACAESIETLAGVTKYFKVPIITYSAEGPSLSDKTTYPYVYRTIGDNGQFRYVYLEFFRKLGWKHIATLSENGQKQSEFVANIEEFLKKNDMTFMADIKISKNMHSSSLDRHLEELSTYGARVIVADVSAPGARALMCVAHRRHMTAAHGYVWILPMWLGVDWHNTTRYNTDFKEQVNCTVAEMAQAINGYFTVSHQPYAPDNALMQEGITVGEWRRNFAAQYWKILGMQYGIEFNKYQRYQRRHEETFYYAGFVYDAVWTFALATDKLLKENPDAATSFRPSIYVHDNYLNETNFNGVTGNIQFHGGTSRFTNINIIQWLNGTSNIVGVFTPEISNTKRKIIGGHLNMTADKIVWLNDNHTVPIDLVLKKPLCFVEDFADFFGIGCEQAIIGLNVFAFLIVTVILVVTVCWFVKKRYERRLKKLERFDEYKPISILDEWELDRSNIVLYNKIGKGAFGKVYLGSIKDQKDKCVAIKMLKSNYSTDEKVDFLYEAESMKRFDHQNIIILVGVCTRHEPVMIVMEFMLYGDLRTYLMQRRHLVNEKKSEESQEVSCKKLTSMALDVARGLSYLANCKHIHRDIAARNCLVNSNRTVKLSDFGMTSVLFENDYYRLNRKGKLPIKWMAPESVGSGIFTIASDVWSYGVLLYEIITFGGDPFPGLSNEEVLECAKKGKSVTTPQGISPQLEGLMKSCWNTDSKMRPHAFEIAEFLANSPHLLTPCLDVPVSLIPTDYSDDGVWITPPSGGTDTTYLAEDPSLMELGHYRENL